MNPLMELSHCGQSPWYDNIRRGLLFSGEIKKMIDEDGLKGVTSNPTIFEKAIAGSTDYNAEIQALAQRADMDVGEIYDALSTEDIENTADLLRPIYDETEGRDGFVSIEVSPLLAHNTETTIREAKRLFERINRPNVMIKVPATPEGIKAIESLIADGINVNVTLIFGIETYQKVANAYISGLEKRMKAGKPIDRVASVASVFVSRIDTAVDNLLQARISTARSEAEQEALRALLGKVAIANTKMVYQSFKEIFGGERFGALKAKGARVQRPLWASTGTKNPKYSDVLYVEELIGPNTVNTMPPATWAAFKDHGRIRVRHHEDGYHFPIEEDLRGARAVLKRLADFGIDLKAVTHQLQEEGVKAFAESFEKLMHAIVHKREAVLGGLLDRQTAKLNGLEVPVKESLQKLREMDFASRLWAKDATLWKKEPEHQRIISNALGWMHVTESMLEHVDEPLAFAEEVRQAGFEHVLLLGMGGSSLCPDVCRITFGKTDGYPHLHVLDSTVPAQVLSAENSIDPEKTLFIVSSKSGTTIEPLMFHSYFFELVQKLKGEKAGDSFIAITDPGSPLENIAHEQKFRRIFAGVPEIGGRYSALSNFGIVPAALAGYDVKTMLDRAERMVESCRACVPIEDNPGIVLGTIMGEMAKRGRDKITFICSPGIAAFGYWVEQLIAESTGKDNTGIVPIEGEPIGEPEAYGNDRLFVYMRLESAPDPEQDRKVAAMEAAGQPVVRIAIAEPIDIGEEFFRWEIATATAGAVLGVNAFDQPNVQEAKDITKSLLDEFKKTGRLPEEKPLLEANGIKVFADPNFQVAQLPSSPEDCLAAHLKRLKAGDYFALTAYIEMTHPHTEVFQAIRQLVRDKFQVATTLGYGPRFLHSTGQLHKGGANNGVFLQITSDDAKDVKIPGEPFTFGVLKQAQALGDFLSLSKRGRRLLRVHIGADVDAGLQRLREAIEEAVAR